MPRGKGLAGPGHLLWSWPAPRPVFSFQRSPSPCFCMDPAWTNIECIKPWIWASHTQRTNMGSKSTYRSGARRAELESIKMPRDPVGEPVLGTGEVYKVKFAHDQQPGQLQDCWQQLCRQESSTQHVARCYQSATPTTYSSSPSHQCGGGVTGPDSHMSQSPGTSPQVMTSGRDGI